MFVVNEDPVANSPPPTEALYHLISAVSVAFNVTIPGPHLNVSFETGDAAAGIISARVATELLGQFFPVLAKYVVD